jgi:MTH538 TIR-like domain (DUF1863)
MHRLQSASSSRCLGHGPMADNPFDPKYSGLLAALRGEPKRNALSDYISPATPEVSPLARAMADLLMDRSKPALPVSLFTGAANDLFSPPKPASPQYHFGSAFADLFGCPEPAPSNALSGAVADLFPKTQLSYPFGALVPSAPSPINALYAPPPKPKPVAPETKRKAFFSFYFEDVMRVNNVRQAWKITHPNSATNRSFYDSSLWESRKITNEEALKRLIRAGVLYTSAVCVLAGTETWERRWVRYEIARAVIDGRGLLTVHLNGLNHHQTRAPHPRGHNPLAFMAIGRHQPDAGRPPLYYLYEKKLVSDGRGGWELGWVRYADHTAPVKIPSWVTEPQLHNYVTPLSANAAEYDYVADHGHRNIGSWIDEAAKRAGR